MQRLATLALMFATVLPAAAHAGELDMNLGVQATTTAWPDDHGGGASLGAVWWFTSWLGGSFVGKEQYAPVDNRYLSYFSVNADARHTLGPLRIVAAVGVVHQHEETVSAIMDQPLSSAFGVADGIRHRMGGRAGFSLGLPLSSHHHGDYYVALDVDGTLFAETDRGPRWMSSLGLSFGFTYDFARRK